MEEGVADQWFIIIFRKDMVFIGIISGFAPLRERDRDINEFVFLEVNYV